MHRLRRRIESWTGPPWPIKYRAVLAATIVAAGYICYRYRLTSAAGFEMIGFAVVFVMLLVKRILWKRSLRSSQP